MSKIPNKSDRRHSDLSNKVYKILYNSIQNNLSEIADAYDIAQEDIDDLLVNIFVHDVSKVRWKSTKTRFVKIYEKTLDRIIESNILTDDELGKLIKLSRRINYEDNILRNPDGSYMCQKDIIQYLGIKKTKAYEFLKKLRKYYLLFHKKNETNKTKRVYYISPEILFIGTHIRRELKYKLNEISKLIKDWEEDKIVDDKDEENKEVNIDYEDYVVGEEVIDEFIDLIVEVDSIEKCIEL